MLIIYVARSRAFARAFIGWENNIFIQDMFVVGKIVCFSNSWKKSIPS